MIHTAKFYILVDDKEIYHLFTKYKSTDVRYIEDRINDKFTYCTTNIRSIWFKRILFLNVDFIKLLNKSDITESDLPKIKVEINKYLNEVFGYDNVDMVLIRIDYRKDIKIQDETHKKLLFYLHKKTLSNYKFKKKYNKYDTTTYFNSRSQQVIVYDKGRERIAKRQPIRNYEKDVVRLEVRLLNRHLNYNKTKKGIAKTLDNYFKEEIYKKYILKEAIPLLYRGDYYKLYYAEKIINNSNITKADKKGIREFLIDISKSSVESVKNKLITNDNGKTVKKYTPYKFRKYIKILEKLNINPILIPKNYKVELENGCLKNFYKF